MSTETEQQQATLSPLEQYAAYSFDTDEVYQQGLASILASNTLVNASSVEEREEVLRRARVFYFNKTSGNSITLDEAREYEQPSRKESSSQSAPSTLSSTLTTAPVLTSPSGEIQGEEEPRALTFAELKELIETGQLDQIPNNKVIPNDLNEAPPSQSTAPARRKPWEVTPAELDMNTSTQNQPI